VGVYIPGGTGGSTPLVSTALMGIIPARCAGVERIVAVSPPGPGGVLNPHLLVAIHRAGAHEIYRIGGAQAVAALALGTASLAPVDKIVGPGNRYVAEAKRQLYGTIDIDKIAGPSEVAVLADDTAPAEYIAADLLAQAEHDPWAMACMVTTDPELAVQVRSAVESQSRGLSRKVVIDEALSNRGALLICRDLKDGISMIEYLAPEHVEIMTRSPLEVSTRIRNAGAIFVGPNSPQAMGDYVAGPNHTLPTGGRARFASPLGVWDFVKRTSVIAYDGAGLVEASRHARRLAQIEGLDAHERSLAIRMP